MHQELHLTSDRQPFLSCCLFVVYYASDQSTGSRWKHEIYRGFGNSLLVCISEIPDECAYLYRGYLSFIFNPLTHRSALPTSLLL
jgi:hypothetical protein